MQTDPKSKKSGGFNQNRTTLDSIKQTAIKEPAALLSPVGVSPVNCHAKLDTLLHATPALVQILKYQ